MNEETTCMVSEEGLPVMSDEDMMDALEAYSEAYDIASYEAESLQHTLNYYKDSRQAVTRIVEAVNREASVDELRRAVSDIAAEVGAQDPFDDISDLIYRCSELEEVVEDTINELERMLGDIRDLSTAMEYYTQGEGDEYQNRESFDEELTNLRNRAGDEFGIYV